MRANILFLKDRFAYFNSLCFDGRLPAVNLRISSSLRTMGTFSHPRGDRRAVPSQLTLSISNRLDLEEKTIEDTIIHEMIHLYIYWNGIKDSSTHGVQFKEQMRRINSIHGRNITVSHRSEASEKRSDRLRKPRLVIISTLRSGERCVTVCSPRYTMRIHEALSKSPMIADLCIIASYDPIFGHYPASQTAKIYGISCEELPDILSKAVKLEILGNKLTPALNR